MPYAAAISEHPMAAHATGEVVGQVLDRVGEEPSLAVLMVSLGHGRQLGDIVATVRAVLRPRVLVGALTTTVVGPGREAERTPAIALWAGGRFSATGHRVTVSPEGVVEGLGPRDLADATGVLLLADPFSFAAEPALDDLRRHLPGDVPLVGGLTAGGDGPGSSRMVLDDRLLTSGAVGVVLRDVPAWSVVSHGCRPVGDPMVVTAADGRLIESLGGRPALSRIRAVLDRLEDDDVARARAGLHLGLVVDEQRERFERGDFVVRNLLGADPRTGVVAVGGEVHVGGTVQVHVRDAASADEDLRASLRGPAAAGLLFTCVGRGTAMFAGPDHDAAVVDERYPGLPLVGMACQGEMGPVGGRSFLHTFTASLLLLGEAP